MSTIAYEKAARAPKRVVGYHGCHIDVARRIVEGESFTHSTNDYDWLGSGVYFWEYGPDRAYEWAQQRFKENAAVVEASITLGHCVNLLDSTHFDRLRESYQDVVSVLANDGLSIPENRKGRNALDRLVLDSYCADYYAEMGTRFDTIRGSFPEGEPVYEGSRILRYSHVQIAVRNCESCISGLKLVHFR